MFARRAKDTDSLAAGRTKPNRASVRSVDRETHITCQQWAQPPPVWTFSSCKNETVRLKIVAGFLQGIRSTRIIGEDSCFCPHTYSGHSNSRLIQSRPEPTALPDHSSGCSSSDRPQASRKPNRERSAHLANQITWADWLLFDVRDLGKTGGQSWPAEILLHTVFICKVYHPKQTTAKTPLNATQTVARQMLHPSGRKKAVCGECQPHEKQCAWLALGTPATASG